MGSDARVTVLVSSDDPADAEMVRKSLANDFPSVQTSIEADRFIVDFDRSQPDVLVLAFNTLSKAEQYYLELYRHSATAHQHPHRTIILCSKDELRRVYELCRRDTFDDYVLYWPMVHDASRLAMSVHIALRELAHVRANRPSAGQLAILARQAAHADAGAREAVTRGERALDTAEAAVRGIAQEIGSAVDAIAARGLSGQESGPGQLLGHQLKRIKETELDPRLRQVEQLMDPARASLGELRDALLPNVHVAGRLRSFANDVRPLILIVEDEETQRVALKHILKSESYTVVFAATGAEAVRAVQKQQPDLVLMDMMLPDIHGLQVMQKIRSIEHMKGIPIIVITGHSEKEIVLKSLAAGAVDFVVKPFSADAILRRIAQHLMPSGQGPAGG